MGLLRRPSVRQRPPALRAPPHGLREGRLPALPDHAGQAGAPPLRLGHARTARRARGDAPARDHREERDRGDGRRGVQRRRPSLGARVHGGVGGLRHPLGPLGRLRGRLQDARRRLHGVGDLGVQAAARQGPRLRGLPRAAVLRARPDAAEQPRAGDGRRRLPHAPGPVRDRHVPARRREGRVARPHRGARARLDDHALDPADQHGARGRAGHRLRRGARRPRGHPRRRGARLPAPRVERAARGRGARIRVPHRPGPRGELRQGPRLRVRRRGPRRRLPHRARPPARGRRVRPPLGLLRGQREVRHGERVAGARRRLRHDDRRHRHRPPGPGLRRGGPAGLRRGRDPRDPVARRGRPLRRHRSRGRGRAVVGRREDAHAHAQGAGPPHPPGQLRALLPALLALQEPAHLQGRLQLVRARHRLPRRHGAPQPGHRVDAREREGRAVRQVDRQRARLVDQPQPLLGQPDPGVEERRPGLPAHRRVRQPRRARGRLRRAPDGPAPPVHRRAHAPEPGRPHGEEHHASHRGRARRLVRLRIHALRPGALPVREPRVVRRAQPGGLHRRVHRPDPRLVLHAARAVDRAVRAAGVLERREPLARPRQRRPEDVQLAPQLPGRQRGVRPRRIRRHALVPPREPRAPRRQPRGHRGGHPRGRPPGAAPALEHLVLLLPLRQLRAAGRLRGAPRHDERRRAGPLHPGRHPPPRHRGHAAHDRPRLDARRRVPPRLRRRAHHLVRAPQPRPVLGGHGSRRHARLRHPAHGPRDRDARGRAAAAARVGAHLEGPHGRAQRPPGGLARARRPARGRPPRRGDGPGPPGRLDRALAPQAVGPPRPPAARSAHARERRRRRARPVRGHPARRAQRQGRLHRGADPHERLRRGHHAPPHRECAHRRAAPRQGRAAGDPGRPLRGLDRVRRRGRGGRRASRGRRVRAGPGGRGRPRRPGARAPAGRRVPAARHRAHPRARGRGPRSRRRAERAGRAEGRGARRERPHLPREPAGRRGRRAGRAVPRPHRP